MQPLALQQRAISSPPPSPQLRQPPPHRPSQVADRFCAQSALAAAGTAQEVLQAPTTRFKAAPAPRPAAMPVPPSAFEALQTHVFDVLDDLHRRSADRSSWTDPMDRYFFAQKHQQVKRVRGLVQAAFDHAARQADHPGVAPLLANDALVDWLAAPPTLEQAVALAAPPPADAAAGAVHRLRHALAQWQLLRQGWPQALI